MGLIDAQGPSVFSKQYLSIKSYLLATAKYLNDPGQFMQLKQSLINKIAVDGKVTGWDFKMFNIWVEISNHTQAKKDQLLALQAVAR